MNCNSVTANNIFQVNDDTRPAIERKKGKSDTNREYRGRKTDRERETERMEKVQRLMRSWDILFSGAAIDTQQ